MRSFLVIVALTSASIASADSKPVGTDAKQMVTDDCAKATKAHKQCVIDMGGETVEGGIGKADGIDVIARAFEGLSKLMHPRRDFIVEIVQSAENLD